jgi:hypothetical protein
MNLEGCGWRKSWDDLMYHIAIYQQGVRKPVNPRVQRRCPGRNLKPGPPVYETGMTLTRSETTCYVYLITLLGFLFVFCIMSLIPSNHARLSIGFVVYVCVNRYWRRGSSDLLKRNYCSRIPTIPCIYTAGPTFVEQYMEKFAHIVWPKINFDISYCNIHRITYSLWMISYIYMHFISGAFTWKSHNNARLASSCLYVHLSVRRARLPLYGFPYLIFEYFSKICWETKSFIKTWQE